MNFFPRPQSLKKLPSCQIRFNVPDWANLRKAFGDSILQKSVLRAFSCWWILSYPPSAFLPARRGRTGGGPDSLHPCIPVCKSRQASNSRESTYACTAVQFTVQVCTSESWVQSYELSQPGLNESFHGTTIQLQGKLGSSQLVKGVMHYSMPCKSLYSTIQGTTESNLYCNSLWRMICFNFFSFFLDGE